MRVKKPRIGK